MNERNDDYYVLVAMEEFGGSFVKSLARAANYADSENYKTLKTAFKKYWDEYRAFEDTVREKGKW